MPAARGQAAARYPEGHFLNCLAARPSVRASPGSLAAALSLSCVRDGPRASVQKFSAPVRIVRLPVGWLRYRRGCLAVRTRPFMHVTNACRTGPGLSPDSVPAYHSRHLPALQGTSSR